MVRDRSCNVPVILYNKLHFLELIRVAVASSSEADQKKHEVHLIEPHAPFYDWVVTFNEVICPP